MSKWTVVAVLVIVWLGSIYADPIFVQRNSDELDAALRDVREDFVTGSSKEIGTLNCIDNEFPNDPLAIIIIKDISYLGLSHNEPQPDNFVRVRIIKVLDYEESTDQNSRAVDIRCRNINYPEKEARFESRLLIKDVNDNAPIFLKANRQDTYEVFLNEQFDDPVPRMIYDKINAVDRDGTLANQVIVPICEDMQVGPIIIGCEGYFELRAVRVGPGNFTIQVFALRNFYAATSYVLNTYLSNTPAEDGLGPTINSSKHNVAIRIIDIQNMPPYIPLESLQFTISEDFAVGTTIGVIKSYDQDRGDPHAISFSLDVDFGDSYGFDEGFFELGPATEDADGTYVADLILAKPIDREDIPDVSDIVYVVLKAQEYDIQGRPNRNEMSATAQISVKVLDMNDERPVFVQQEYNVVVPETTGPVPIEQVDEPQQLLANLAVTDKDSNRFNSFLLTFIEGNEQGIFSLDRYNGSRNAGFIMYIKKGALDYENNFQNTHRLVLQATDINRSDLTSTTVVNVEIVDVNDNKPRFISIDKSFNVPENSEPGLIGRVEAVDDDEGDVITYRLQGDSIFSINNDGQIFLNGSVDYETRSSYQVSITATDKDNQQAQITVTIVIVNVNDVGPRFPEEGYTAFLYEESVVLNPEIILQAVSAEAGQQVLYGIQSVSPAVLNGYFAVDPISGKVNVLRPINYKQTDAGIVILTFTATAGDLTSTTIGTINIQDINNYPPVFQPNTTVTYFSSVSELAQPGETVYQMSVLDLDGEDSDNGRVVFAIVQGSNDNFNIGFESGAVVIAANAQLDVDELATYTLLIKARDLGNPVKSSTATLIINLLDANNKPPEFEESVLVTTVKEGTRIGAEITRVTATDPDKFSVINYSLNFFGAEFRKQSEVINFLDGNKYFSIDRTQGILQVAGNIQRSMFDRVQFKILAEDTNITIGQPRQTATVDIRVTVLASDEQRIYFNTKDGVQYNPTLTKDFSETPLGQSINQIFSLRAIDPNVSREVTTYREAAGYDPLDYLRVSQSYVLLERALDYEELPGGPSKQLSTVVLAISDDRLRTGTATVIVNVLDINDNRPIFENNFYEFNIEELKSHPTRVGTVKATDRDSSSYGQVNYELSGPNNEDFQIYTEKSGSNNIGVIRIAENRTLDYETNSVYNLQVIARDNPLGRSSDRLRATVSVTINVNDSNDNVPTFREDEYSFTVVGTTEVKGNVGIVIADDLDIGRNGDVNYFIQSSTNGGTGYFSIKTEAQKAAQPGDTFNVGVLYVRQSLESLPEATRFEMIVLARDNDGRTPQLTGRVRVYITVSKGVKDPKPKWIEGLPSTVEIFENSPVGTFVAQLIARPANDSSGIQYSFVTSGNNFGDWQNFMLDTESGRITVNGDLDYESQIVYSDSGETYVRNLDLLVLATDTANSTLRNQFLLVVKILDVDDNDPSFTSCPDKTYPIPVITTVLETIEPPVFVYQAQACDLDTEAYNAMQYSWYYDDTYCDPSTALVFSLDADDGMIYTKIMLDRETTPEYLLCIQVDKKDMNTRRKRDMVSDLRARDNHDTVLYVKVIVEDVNDNGASFRDPFVQTVMLEYPQVSVSVSEAEDRDLPPNNGIRYSIDSITFTKDGKTQSQPAAFSINGDDGTIVIGQNDYSDFAGGYFELVVRASDLYNGDLFDRQIQKIYVTNKVNQIRVVFDEPADQNVQQKATNMVNELNALDRGFYQIKRISYHTIDNDQDPSFDKTDVCMVVMRYDNVLTATDGSKELNEPDEFKIIRKYGARDPGPCEPAKSVYPGGWESYWWVLVAFAIVIFILVLILIILICILHRQYRRYMDTRRTYLVPGN